MGLRGQITQLLWLVAMVGTQPDSHVEHVNFDQITYLRQQGDLQLAEKLLNQLSDEDTRKAIADLYKSENKNAELVLRIAKNLSSVGKSLTVLSALQTEQASAKHNSPLNNLALATALRTEVAEQDNGFPQQKAAALELIQSLEDHTAAVVKELLKTSLTTGSLSNETRLTVDEVHDYDRHLLARTVKSALDEVYDSADIWQVVECFRKMSYIEQVVSSLEALMETMVVKNHMNQPTVLGLAHAASEVYTQESFHKVKPEIRDSLLQLKDKLPASVRAVAFAESHCIRNDQEKSYIYAAVEHFKYSSKQRNVFGWVNGNFVNNGVWQFDRAQHNAYYIRNKGFNEYLFSPNKLYDSDRRYVFTSMDKRVGNGSLFLVEPEGDDCYIKNVLHSSYLYAANGYFNFDKKRRRTFTWVPGSKVIQSKWRLSLC